MNDDKDTTMENEVVINATHSKLVEHRTVEDVMEDSFLRFSMSVIIDRALPDVRAGVEAQFVVQPAVGLTGLMPPDGS